MTVHVRGPEVQHYVNITGGQAKAMLWGGGRETRCRRRRRAKSARSRRTLHKHNTRPAQRRTARARTARARTRNASMGSATGWHRMGASGAAQDVGQAGYTIVQRQHVDQPWLCRRQTARAHRTHSTDTHAYAARVRTVDNGANCGHSAVTRGVRRGRGHAPAAGAWSSVGSRVT